MAFYDRAAATSKRLLAKYGQTITLTRAIPTAEYDPVTGEIEAADSSVTAVGVVFDYERREIDGTMVQQGDAHLYLSPDIRMTPIQQDIIRLATGEIFKIVTVKSVAPSGQVVLWDIQLRK